MEDKPNFTDFKTVADEYFRENKLEKAIENYTLALEENKENEKNNFKLYMNRCLTYFNLNKFDEALDDAIKATRLNNESSKAWSRVGSCLMSLKKYKQAEKAFEKACELESTNEFYKNLLDNSREMIKKNKNVEYDSDTEDEDKVEDKKETTNIQQLTEKLEELKKSNNLPNLLNSDMVSDGLVDGLFNSMLSNNKLMDKLTDKEFQNKVVTYQKNPFAIFGDKEMMELMNDIITKTKFDQ